MSRVFAAGVVFGIGTAIAMGSLNAGTPDAVAAVSSFTADEQNTISVFAEAAPSVVFVESAAQRRDPWTRSVTEVPGGSGSGFMWDAEGHIVTNFHVIQGASSLSIKLQDGSSWPATVVGADPSKDVAVLTTDIPRKLLRPVTRGQSGALRVGQKVVAIGNPFGLDHSLTSGVISALGREIEAMNGRTIHGVVQTDAAINPGNSGGPLLDSSGHVIGINTAIFSPSGASAGIGFAVPIDTVERIVPQLIEHGRVLRPALGITFVSARIAAQNGIDGVILRSVDPDGPAAVAGLKGLQQSRNGRIELGDVIVGINEMEVRSPDDLLTALEAQTIGQRCTVKILRDDRELTLDVQLAEIADFR